MDLEEIYRNLEMVCKTGDIKPEERAELEGEILKYKAD